MIGFIIILIILGYYIQQLSMKNSIEGLIYSIKTSKLKVEPLEEFEIITSVKNDKFRFISFLRFEEHFAPQTNILNKGAKFNTDIMGNLVHKFSTYMLPKSKLERRFRANLPARGLYVYKGELVKSGDFLGIHENIKYLDVLTEILVYPKAINMANMQNMLGGFLGDLSVRRFIMEDPVLTVGSREYTSSDPMKNISWKHSARTGKLMVKQFDYTVEATVSIMLDVNTKKMDEERKLIFEKCFSIARSVCEMLEQKGIKYDFITNATTCSALSSWDYVAEGLGRSHFNYILEGLSRASAYRCNESYQKTIEKLIKMQEIGRSTIIITPEKSLEKDYLANNLRAKTNGIVTTIYGEDVLVWNF